MEMYWFRESIVKQGMKSHSFYHPFCMFCAPQDFISSALLKNTPDFFFFSSLVLVPKWMFQKLPSWCTDKYQTISCKAILGGGSNNVFLISDNVIEIQAKQFRDFVHNKLHLNCLFLCYCSCATSQGQHFSYCQLENTLEDLLLYLWYLWQDKINQKQQYSRQILRS